MTQIKSAIELKPFLTAAEVLEVLPIDGSTLRKWRTYCPPLGRALTSEPNPQHSNRPLHSARDVYLIEKRFRAGPRAEEFTDDAGSTWLLLETATQDYFSESRIRKLAKCGRVALRHYWFTGGRYPFVCKQHLEEVRKDDVQPTEPELFEKGLRWVWLRIIPIKYNFSLSAISLWRRHGRCRLLGKRKIRFYTKAGRVYVSADDMDAAVQARNAAPITDAQWATLAEAVSVSGKRRGFFWAHGSISPTGKKHPVLGRKFKLDERWESRGKKTSRVVLIWRKDLNDLVSLLAEVPKRKGLVSITSAEEQGYNPSNLYSLAVRGKLKMTKYPIFSRDGRSMLVNHIPAAKLAKVSKNPRAEIGDESRVHVDAAGGRWLLQTEAAEILGVQSGGVSTYRKNWKRSCEHLDGKPWRCQKVRMPQSSSHDDRTWVYHEGDTRAIKAKMNGWHVHDAKPPTMGDVHLEAIHAVGKRVEVVGGKVEAGTNSVVEIIRTIKPQRGRPGMSNEEHAQHKQLWDDWQRFKGKGRTQKDFCVEKRLTTKEWGRIRHCRCVLPRK